MEPALFLIPVTLGDTSVEQVLPVYNKEIILPIRHFIVENIRSARRFLKQVDRNMPIDEIVFYELNKHTSQEVLSTFLKPLESGLNIGLLSEAGCPAVADPGAQIVSLAQKKRIKVVPLVGPSSILLALMASGFNGQSFAFHGYLPIDKEERNHKLKQLENRLLTENQTQLFIETPYRNDKLLEDIIKICKPTTLLCIAADITLPDEFIQTRSIAEWKKNLPQIGKRPCMFALGS
jgi:Predicted methyltransferases